MRSSLTIKFDWLCFCVVIGYSFSMFEQLMNEAAKFRFRSGGSTSVGQLTVRMPYGAVGHGGCYHSQRLAFITSMRIF
jgi:pyruvate/2-oxoglutarate/acetoin dehydrogenase E1 component